MFQYQHVKCKSCDEIINREDVKTHDCSGFNFNDLTVMASWGICNTASLNVFEMNSDAMLVAINDNKPQWCEIDSFFDEDWKDKGLEDERNQGIDYKGTIYFLDECMKV